MSTCELIINSLISFFASFIGVLLVLWIERQRRPKLSMSIGGPNYLKENDVLGRPECKWLRVFIKNRDVPRFILWFYQGEPALSCQAKITFFHLDKQKVFDREMEGRWAGSQEPKSESIDTINGLAYRLVVFQHTYDIPSGEGADLDIAIRLNGEEECYGWTDESYINNWKHPQWKLDRGRYIAKISIKTGGREFSDAFYIVNDIPYNDFRLAPVEHKIKKEILKS